MDKIKTVKIKNLDGSVSEETYTISVDARNVDMDNGKDLQDTIGNINVDTDGNIVEQLENLNDNVDNLNIDIKKKAYFFNTVADMKNANLKVGDYACTLGYYEPNDGGGANYQIINRNGVETDEGLKIKLNNTNLIGKLIKKYYITPETFGAIADGQSHPLSEKYNSLTDAQKVYSFATSLNEEIDGLAIQKAINYFNKVQLSAKMYKINTNINVKNNLTIWGCGGNTQLYSTEKDLFIFNDNTTVDIGYMNLRCGNNYNIITINGSSWKNNRVHDLIIGGCKRFITNAYYNNSAKSTYPIIYDCSIKNIWMYAVTGNYTLDIKGTGHFNFTIEQLHNGIGSVYLGEGYFKFVDCNFGFKNGTTFIADTASTILIMDRCNIECDELLTSSNVFEIKCAKAYFHLCDFVIRLDSNKNFIKLTENAIDIRFEQCRQIKYPSNLGILFNNYLTIGTSRVNGVKFIGSSGLLSDLDFTDLATVYKSAVRYNHGDDLQYIYQASQLSQVPKRSLFIYSDKKLYYKWDTDEYYDISGNPKIFE